MILVRFAFANPLANGLDGLALDGLAVETKRVSAVTVAESR